jgi:small ligand-binding sensory domain FIST
MGLLTPRSIVTRVSVHIATGLSTTPDARAGALEAASAAARGLEGHPCDLVVMFASGTHLAAPESTLEAVHEMLAPENLIGCGAGGVIGGAREVEDGTAVVVWAASLGDGEAAPFHATVEEIEEGSGTLAGLPDLDGATGAILLADPFSFPTDAVLRFLSESTPLLPLLGGVASAPTAQGTPALFYGEELVDGGAVGVRLDGVEVLPCVSQGAAPIGPELTITAADGHIIVELAGKPALSKLREAIEGLSDEDRGLVDGGLLMGIVVDPNKPDYLQGDFLVRGLVGADPDTGQVAVGTNVRPGQVVRLHARDAGSADRDLREALGIRMQALGGRTPAGALVFACNGRGRGMFSCADHDAEAIASELAGAPAAGFFAAGEIGPVGGEYFLHSFTATVAVFAQ